MLGLSNMKGHIASVHWYHRKRITEENRLPFGRMIGLGTIICGVSLVIFGCLSFVAEKIQIDLFLIIGSVIEVPTSLEDNTAPLVASFTVDDCDYTVDCRAA